MSAPSILVRVTLAALALGVVAGCSDRLPTPAAPPAEGGQASASLPLLSLIADAPASVAHYGVRRFESYGIDGSLSDQLVYTEEIYADGLGKISLSPLQVIAPAMSDADKAIFLLTQKLRERTMYFARDFGIRDPDLFAANYSLVDTGTAVVVAGVNCERLQVAKRIAPDRRYVIDVDTSNGLVLRSREELLDGTLVTLTAYQSIDYTPDLSNVSWNVPLNGELDLVPGTSDVLTHLGFQPPTPKVLPAGWQQIGLAKVVDPTNGQVWARLTYSDGVEQIFFVVAKGKGPGQQLKNPPAGSPPSGPPDRVRKLGVGAWTLLEAELSLGRVLVLGRAPDSVLEGLIQSAFY